jgi:ATP/maltotriose-dependent transcriptional regulator MalT
LDRSEATRTLDFSKAKGRHRDWYLQLAELAQPELIGEDQETWLDRLDVEHDNLRAALDWSLNGDHNAEAALRLCSALWRFWDMRGYIVEGQRWLKLCLEADGKVLPLLRAKALSAAGNLALEQAEYDRALAHHDAALALRRQAGDKQAIAQSLNNLGVLARRRGDYDRAAQLYEECLAIFNELGHEDSIAGTLDNLGFVERCRGRYERAEELYAKALELFQELGDTSGIVISLNNLGDLARLRRHYERAMELYGQAMELATGLGDLLSIAGLLTSFGAVANQRGEHEQAVELYLASLFKYKELGYRQGMAECLEGLATAEIRDQPERAAQLFGATQTLRESIAAPLPPPERAAHEKNVARLRARLGESLFLAAWAGGRAMHLDDAIALATEGAYHPPVPQASTPPSGSEPVDKGYPPVLTRRELQILRLAASGLRSVQIAGKLGVSERTVGAHLHSIYGKIGVDSRAAATRFAIEHHVA